MNKGLWIARKNHFCCLIRKVSDAWGGDETEWLRVHCMQVIDAHPDELIEVAITCYTEMLEQAKCITQKRVRN